MQSGEYVLSNINNLFQRIQQQKQHHGNSKEYMSELEALVHEFPFLFAYFKQLVGLYSGDIEAQLRLVDQQLHLAPFCQQNWEVYIDFAKQPHMEQVFDVQTVILLYKQYLALNIHCNTEFIVGYFAYLIERADSQQFLAEVRAFLSQNVFIPDIAAFYTQVGQIFNTAQKVLDIEAMDSYRQNVENSRLITQHEASLAKRNFYHSRQLKGDQLAAIQKLINVYAEKKQIGQLIRLFYIGLAHKDVSVRIYFVIMSLAQQGVQEEVCEAFMTTHRKYLEQLCGADNLQLRILTDRSAIQTGSDLVHLKQQLLQLKYESFVLGGDVISRAKSQLEFLQKLRLYTNQTARMFIQFGEMLKAPIHCNFTDLDSIFKLIVAFEGKQCDCLIIEYLKVLTCVRLDDVLANMIELGNQMEYLSKNAPDYYLLATRKFAAECLWLSLLLPIIE